jgi:galactarate dehydratase
VTSLISPPRFIRVNALDNVAIVANEGGLPPGTPLGPGSALLEHIPEAHKVALVAIDEGAPVIRYGAPIGYAARSIPPGAWVHEGNIRLPQAPDLHSMPLATGLHPPLEPLQGFTFEGFLNEDGSVGTRNILGISTTVQCVAAVIGHAVNRIKADLLPRFPYVDDVVAITHSYGCGVAIDAPGAEIPIRTLRNLSAHPNFGGAPLIVGLGCEKLQPVRLMSDGALPVLRSSPRAVSLQDPQFRGFDGMIRGIMLLAEQRLALLNERRRVTRPAADLVVGLQCGGSDAFSGVTANPAVGYASDLLVRSGATVLFSEVTEVRDAAPILIARSASDQVANELIEQLRWYDEYLGRGASDRSANTTPGNKAGGLSNIVEKALGSIAKTGTANIEGVSGPGERVTRKGLIFAATPASDFICGTLQLAAGMNMHIFTTGRGSPYGLAMAPVLKIASRPSLAEQWPDLIDVDAGTIATGAATIPQVGEQIFRLILDVASGRTQACADRLGLHNDLVVFNPAPVT